MTIMTLPNGKTSQQIKAAPAGALYIVHNNVHASYVRRLARYLRRDESYTKPSLHVACLDDLEIATLRGACYSKIILDHSLDDNQAVTLRHSEIISELRSRCMAEKKTA